MTALAADPALQLALQAGGALLFGSAALHKLRRPRAFRAALAGYRLLPRAAVPAAALALAGLEAAIAVGCILPASADAAAAAGAGLVTLYAAAVAANLVRGRRAIDCGCSGPGGPRPLGADVLVRNGLLAAALALASLPSVPRAMVWLDAVSAAGALAAGALLYAALDVALANAARSRLQEAAWATR